jgi:hypothetical protein
VRRGASWTAAYHRQLTVAAVARPVRGGVGAPASLLLSGPGGCSPRRRLPRERPAALEGSGVVAVVDTASRHATASVAAVQHAVSPHPVLASGIRLSSRPVSGHLGSSSRGSGGRPSAVHPSGVQPSGVCPRPSGRVRLLHLRRWRWDQGRAGRATVTTGTGGGLVAAGVHHRNQPHSTSPCAGPGRADRLDGGTARSRGWASVGRGRGLAGRGCSPGMRGRGGARTNGKGEGKTTSSAATR